jgi:hypothetical protein
MGKDQDKEGDKKSGQGTSARTRTKDYNKGTEQSTKDRTGRNSKTMLQNKEKIIGGCQGK